MTKTGLGFPDWNLLGAAYGITVCEVPLDFERDEDFIRHWNSLVPVIFVVPIHPEQTYFPKISSRVLPDGGMESAPLHDMSPEMSLSEAEIFRRYLPD